MLSFGTTELLMTSGLESSVSLLDFCLSSPKVAYTLLKLSVVVASGAKSLSAVPDFGASLLGLSAKPGLLK